MKSNKIVKTFNSKDFKEALSIVTHSVNVYGNYSDFGLDFDLKSSELERKEKVRFLTDLVKANATQSVSVNHNEVQTYEVSFNNDLFEFTVGPTFLLVKKSQKENVVTFNLENILENLYITL